MEYAFFPGCVIPATYPQYEKLLLDLLEEFGITMNYLSESTCCPAPFSFELVNEEARYYVAARNICEAEELGQDLVSPCSGCVATLLKANTRLKSDADLRRRANEALNEIGKEFKGSSEVKSVLRVLYEDIGPERIQTSVERPLQNMRVAVHYGCHLFEELHRFDDVNNPTSLQTLLKALGAEVVPYDEENLCCFVYANPVDRDFALDAVAEKVRNLNEVDADCFVVMCPSCFTQLDSTQEVLTWIAQIEESMQKPVYFYPQLLAYAMGVSPKKLGLGNHKVEAGRFFSRNKAATSP
jgi:heterodisulfide reductase subunit B